VKASLANLSGPIIGTVATGNRVLVIGDSIIAGTASRYGGTMCAGLVPLGWRVAVEAEAGKMTGFGRTVLRDRLYEGWDAAVVFLGTNYSGSAAIYEKDLTAIVTSLAPRPTLLLTTTLYRTQMQEVNNVIRLVASKNSHVSVLDWGTTSTQTGVLNKDKIHPTTAGRQVLVSSIVAAMGTAPSGAGSCLPSKYTDDSSVTDDVMPSTSIADEAITTETENSETPISNTTVPLVTTSVAPTVTTLTPVP
jgi:lysophospholipase L1-like esterase